MSKKKPVHVSPETFGLVQALATKRDWPVGDTADHLIKVGHSRIKALKTHAKKAKAKAKAEEKAEKPATKEAA